MNSKFFVVNPDTMPGDGDLCMVAKASDIHGGFTVVNAWAVSDAVGTLNLVLQNYGTSGTVAGGTVAGMGSGTATVWAEHTPQELTITAANAFVDANEVLMLKKVESAAGNDLGTAAAVVVEYVDGVVTQG
jgi:hypothetical protein